MCLMRTLDSERELKANMVAFLPKADIHLHAETRARVDRLVALSERRPSYDWPARIRRLSEMPVGIARLEAINSGLEVTELDRLAKEYFVEWLADAMREAGQDAAVLVEVRFGAGWVMWPDLIPRFREADRLTQTAYPDFCAEAIISGVSPGRPDGHSVFNACLEARHAGLAGVDFFPVPYEKEAERAQWEEFYAWAERAAAVGLGITIHAGEFTPANVRSALAVPGVARIGHAVHAAFTTALLEELKKAQVTVECCLTSNVVLGAVPTLQDHPIRTFVDGGVPVTLNSDDPVGLNTTIGTEYELAKRLGFSTSDLLGFTRNGIVSSFTSDQRKSALLSKITHPAEVSNGIEKR